MPKHTRRKVALRFPKAGSSVMLGVAQTFLRASRKFSSKKLANKDWKANPCQRHLRTRPKNIIAIIIIMDSRAYVSREGNGSFKSPALEKEGITFLFPRILSGFIKSLRTSFGRKRFFIRPFVSLSFQMLASRCHSADLCCVITTFKEINWVGMSIAMIQSINSSALD